MPSGSLRGTGAERQTRRRCSSLPMSASNENEAAAIVAESSDLLDEFGLARRLKVARSTLQNWRYTGRGPRWIKLGRLIRYRMTDVDAFLLANTKGSVG